VENVFLTISTSLGHTNLLASGTSHIPGICADGVLLSSLDYLLVESCGGDWRKVCDSSLHIVSMPVGRKVSSLFSRILESYST
jgi:hypothetical protein